MYDGYATQIVFRSESLVVRTECLVWAANRLDVGYLWGYERAAAVPDAMHVCSLTEPHRDLTAIVIEETGFAPVTAAERRKREIGMREHPRFGLECPSEQPAGHLRQTSRPLGGKQSADMLGGL